MFNLDKAKKRLIPSKTELLLALGIFMAAPTSFAGNNPEKTDKKPNYGELLENHKKEGAKRQEALIQYVKNRKVISEEKDQNKEIIFNRNGYEIKTLRVKNDEPDKNGNVIILLDKKGKAVYFAFETLDQRIRQIDTNMDGLVDRTIINRSNKTPNEREKINTRISMEDPQATLVEHGTHRTYMGITIVDMVFDKKQNKIQYITFDDLPKPDIQESTGNEGNEEAYKLQELFLGKFHTTYEEIINPEREETNETAEMSQ